MWHGYVDGHPEVDERGLTEEIARRKAQSVADRLVAKSGGGGECGVAGAPTPKPAGRVYGKKGR